MFNLGDLEVGDEFTHEDTGFGGSGRVDKFWGHVIGKTSEQLVAVRYGKIITTGNGSIWVDDKGEKPRTGLWDSRMKVKIPLAVVKI